MQRMSTILYNKSMIALLKERLQGYRPRRISGPDYMNAGVIVPLFEKDGQTTILLTRRSDQLRKHRGEVSFPGGMCEDGEEGTLTTALRECGEEIGVKATDIEIIGSLDDEVTITGIVITPHVGVIPFPYPFFPNPREVAYLIYLPLADLIERADHSSMYFGRDHIWGSTWSMLLNLKQIVA
jgi:8-oxo-dGTP pyrophosphatase MutT (NUDIX family)